MAEEGTGVPRDRFCDLVMKGGITSGVVYPKAISTLAKAYRFHAIGGSSVGAIAAALTAAAEYRRRQTGSDLGFVQLDDLPGELADPPRTREIQPGEEAAAPRTLNVGSKAGTTLLSLIRPEPGTRRLYQSFLESLEKKTTGGRWLGSAWGIVRAYWLTALLGLLLGVVLAWPGASALALVAATAFTALACLAANRWIALGLGVGLLLLGLPVLPSDGLAWRLAWWPYAAVLVAVSVLLAVGLHLYRDIVRELVPNGFGACRCGPGRPEDDGRSPALTVWLHRKIQSIAGLGPDQVLTFGRLWSAKDSPRETVPSLETLRPVAAGVGDATGAAQRSIDLTLFTTNLSHGRPYLFPLEDETSRLFFEPEALRAYFPESVIQWMLGRSDPYQARSVADPPASEVLAKHPTLRELPPPGDLPVIVAARLSLSFPLLFSAVPLWAIDHPPGGRRDRAGAASPVRTGTMRQCWFSDGGICTNFPIHLFDSFVPAWPTFAISLESSAQDSIDDEHRAWVPAFHRQGRADLWGGFGDHDAKDGLRELGGFLAAIVSTAKNWADSSSARMPGVRERVVRVYLSKDEGGLNLRMPAEKIRRLGGTGKRAADELLKRYRGTADQLAPGWLEHRWIRFNAALVAVRARLKNLTAAATAMPYAQPLAEQIADAARHPPLAADPLGDDDPAAKALAKPEADSLKGLLDVVLEVQKDFDRLDARQPYQPSPTPTIRMRPPL